MSLPVFDSTTPKVSVLAIGMETLASANALVSEAASQTAKFQTTASDKAGFILQACGQVPGGTWMASAKNANVDSGTLTADLEKSDGTYVGSKTTFKDGDTFKNDDGQFVKQGEAGQTFSSTVKKCTLANATGVRLAFKGGEAPLLQYKSPEFLEPGAIASFLVNKSFALNYIIQAFQGPYRGWMAVDTDHEVILTDSTSTVGFKSNVQVGPEATRYDTTISFVVLSNSDQVQIQVNQVIDQNPASQAL